MMSFVSPNRRGLVNWGVGIHVYVYVQLNILKGKKIRLIKVLNIYLEN